MQWLPVRVKKREPRRAQISLKEQVRARRRPACLKRREAPTGPPFVPRVPEHAPRIGERGHGACRPATERGIRVVEVKAGPSAAHRRESVAFFAEHRERPGVEDRLAHDSIAKRRRVVSPNGFAKTKGFLPASQWTEHAIHDPGRIIGQACNFIEIAQRRGIALRLLVPTFAGRNTSPRPVVT